MAEEVTRKSSKQSKNRTNRTSHALRTIFHSLKNYRLLGILTSVTIIFEAAMQIMIPSVMSSLIDFGIVARSNSAAWYYGFQLLIFAAFSVIAGAISGVCCAHSSAGFGKNLRHNIFSQLQSLSFSDLDKFSTGTIVTRMTSDVSNVQFAYQLIIRSGVRSVVIIAVAWWFTFSISPAISWVFLSFVPIVGLIGAVGAAIVAPKFMRIYRIVDELNNQVGENLHNIRVVKSYVREDYENSRFMRISLKLYEHFLKAEYVLNYSIPLFNLCFYTGMLLVAWMASREIVASGNNPAFGLTTGNLAALVVFALQILFALANLVAVFVMTVTARASMHRIAAVLQSKNTETVSSKPLTELSDASVRFEHVSLKYSKSDNSNNPDNSDNPYENAPAEREILQDINLSIPSGSTVGIVGATGSGKSSLVQLIARLYDVTKGAIFVGGANILDYDPQSLREEVGVVLQKNILFSGTISENLRWGRADASDADLREACKIACADEFINDLPDSYNTYIEQGGKNISGGQRQRLCIARALLRKPKILILDDSMSAVDMKTDRKIREGLKNFMPDSTQIIVAQRISSIEHADIIVVLQNSRILAQGSHEELIKSCEVYKNMAASQAKSRVQSQGNIAEEGVE
ncbi:ATP-binding protein of ABC transporter [Gardnerella vaginalis 6119V5]|uniref:ABC transporter ATP-binding protein n=1 Tax=Gardnerella vaginalis TaxID=2702 RepID=UPI0002635A8F|nr:ABC transporter ATP-binding protein [Gardnerella vaginalis]EIK87368.1 ATP-binding protein of ABC transporter [Gardnerella vaginalis 6119V5]